MRIFVLLALLSACKTPETSDVTDFDSFAGGCYGVRSGDTWERRVWDIGYADPGQGRYLCGLAETSPSPAPPPSMFPFKVNAAAQ